LTHVSPRSGRAVSGEAGFAYRDRLLTLPEFLLDDSGEEQPTHAEIVAGLALTGHFLERHVFAPENREIPAARSRLVNGILRATTLSGNSNVS
jgi:DNA repair protein RecO (recombination protein O)